MGALAIRYRSPGVTNSVGFMPSEHVFLLPDFGDEYLFKKKIRIIKEELNSGII